MSGNVVKRVMIVTTSPSSFDDYSSHNPRDDNKVMSLFNYSGEQFGDSASCCICKSYNTELARVRYDKEHSLLNIIHYETAVGKESA